MGYIIFVMVVWESSGEGYYGAGWGICGKEGENGKIQIVTKVQTIVHNFSHVVQFSNP